MLRVVLIVLLAGFCLPLSAPASALHSDPDTAASQEEIKKLELDLARMLAKSDWDQYSSHLAEDFVRIDEQGVVLDKAALLTNLRSGKPALLSVMPEELVVRIYGDTAVLTGHLTVLRRQNGKVTTSFLRYTEVFVRRAGQWSSVTLQTTQVGE